MKKHVVLGGAAVAVVALVAGYVGVSAKLEAAGRENLDRFAASLPPGATLTKGDIHANPLRGGFSVDALALRMPDGSTVRAERLDVSNSYGMIFGAEAPGRVALSGVEAKAPGVAVRAASLGVSSPKPPKADAKTAEEFIASMAAGGLDAESVVVDGAGETIQMGSVRTGAVTNGKVASLDFGTLSFTEKATGGGSGTLASASIKDIDVLLALKTFGPDRLPFDTVDLRDGRFVKGGKAGVSFAQATVSGLHDGGASKPFEIIVKRGVIDSAGVPDAQVRDALSDNGLQTLRVDAAVRGTRAVAEGLAHVELETLAIDGLGSLKGDLRLSGVPQDMADPRAAVGVMLDGVSITFTDRSLVEKAIKSAAKMQGADPAAQRRNVVDSLRGIGTMMNLKDQSEQLARFIEKPGELTIAAKPGKPVQLAAIGMGMAMNPPQTIKQIGLTVESK